mmetsp:Transcript_20190/g.56240  ORF Transcript_20190/g.56240 Transcript_20190/m.56240 type:complete len:301 (+) Transcript_20190:1449-2351(+)
MLLGQLHAGFQGGIVDALKHLPVQLLGLRAVEGHAHEDESICQALAADADGAVAEVGAACGLDRVVVDVDDLVQVAGHAGSDLCQLLKVKEPVLSVQGADELLGLTHWVHVLFAHKAWQRNGCQVAHSRLLRAGVLNDLSAQVGALDGAQVLLVGLAVAAVLEQHVRVASLDLGLQDGEPQLLGTYHPACTPHALILLVQLVKLLSPAVCQALSLIGTEQGPLAVGLHTAHEQVIDPQAIEQVSGTGLFLAMVLAQVQPVKDVTVPGLQVDGESALALAATLVHIPCSVVEHPQHGHDAV